jgi:hypothetical protein
LKARIESDDTFVDWKWVNQTLACDCVNEQNQTCDFCAIRGLIKRLERFALLPALKAEGERAGKLDVELRDAIKWALEFLPEPQREGWERHTEEYIADYDKFVKVLSESVTYSLPSRSSRNSVSQSGTPRDDSQREVCEYLTPVERECSACAAPPVAAQVDEAEIRKFREKWFDTHVVEQNRELWLTNLADGLLLDFARSHPATGNQLAPSGQLEAK